MDKHTSSYTWKWSLPSLNDYPFINSTSAMMSSIIALGIGRSLSWPNVILKQYASNNSLSSLFALTRLTKYLSLKSKYSYGDSLMNSYLAFVWIALYKAYQALTPPVSSTTLSSSN